MKINLPWNKKKNFDPSEIPVPPYYMRSYVGPTEEAAFDNLDGGLVYPQLTPEDFNAVLDFGCGCGRTARQLILQNPQPKYYLGVDLHPEMIDWCKTNLRPIAPQFKFHYHDVQDKLFNPGQNKPEMLPFPVESNSFTLAIAHSIFTHLVEKQAEFYLKEMARILHSKKGILNSSWFLFDKTYFPMMNPENNALFVSDTYPPTAVLYDREWLKKTANNAGLLITDIQQPVVSGYQWFITMRPTQSGYSQIDLPSDQALPGMPADLMKKRAEAG